MTINVGIVGGAGYTGGELIRLLLHHPNTSITWVHSRSQAGQPVTSIHQDLLGETTLSFTDQADLAAVQAIFLCMGHGQSGKFLAEHKLPLGLKVIDLSRDFRLAAPGNDFVYGLPELQKARIASTDFVANCGCFATAIQLALLPLAKAQALQGEVHVHAITGATGAGQQPRSTTHFSWRNNNLSIYKAFTHQHLDEINQSLRQLQPEGEFTINFLPLRGDFPRGIFASVYLRTSMDVETARAWYADYYEPHPFVVISAENPHLKMVVNTNKCVLHLQEHEGKLLIISAIDNLLKGAAGQAVQNMNLLFQLPETTGLHLKALVF